MGTAFIVTRVGQIRNAQNFIQQFHTEKNVLVMMFTPNDSSLLLNMQNVCRKELFEDVLYLRLPKKPVRLTPGKGRRIYRDMESVMEQLKDKYEVTRLFLCNINNYYVYFERINRQRAMGMRLNLLEEGLTTYKITSEDAFLAAERKVNLGDVKKSAKKLAGSIVTIGKQFLKIFVNTGILILQTLSLLVGKNLVDRGMRLVTRLTVSDTYQYGTIQQVDKAYLCFPEMAKASELKIGSIQQLDFRFSELKDPGVLSQTVGYSNLFINQKYVNYKSHFRILFQIFREMGLTDVLIKLHPKEKIADIVRILDPVKEEYPEIRVRILGDMGQVPVEDLVRAADLKQVIGLTSSALIYLKEYLPEAGSISIARRYRHLCETQEKVPLRELAQFDDEYRFFVRFQGIPQFGQEEET